MDGSDEETAKRSTHDEMFAKIHHRLVLYVKEKEQIDELRQTRAKLEKERISCREDEHKRQNQSRCKDREFALSPDSTYALILVAISL